LCLSCFSLPLSLWHSIPPISRLFLIYSILGSFSLLPSPPSPYIPTLPLSVVYFSLPTPRTDYTRYSKQMGQQVILTRWECITQGGKTWELMSCFFPPIALRWHGPCLCCFPPIALRWHGPCLCCSQ
jgi:hypothetical protein